MIGYGYTSSPSYKLDVNGSFNAVSGYIGGYAIATQSWVTSQGYITSSGSCAYASSAGYGNTVLGSYTTNGGQQGPAYFGRNRVGFLMMNTVVNGNGQYKDWVIMDCYSGNDVGGGVAIGVNRQALGAYIMRSEAARSSWSQSAELIGTHNYTSYCATATQGSHADTAYGWGNHASAGYTKNTGTVTSVAVKINGSVKGTVTGSGTIDLGTGWTKILSLSGVPTSGTSGEPGMLYTGGTSSQPALYLCVGKTGQYTYAWAEIKVDRMIS